jgi:hypothetical protein
VQTADAMLLTPDEVRDAWLATQPPTKRAEYHALLQSTLWDQIDPALRKMRVKDFTKVEALPSSAARVISPMEPTINVAVGPVVWLISAIMKSIRFMVKGQNLDQRHSTLAKFLGRRVLAKDFTLFDGSIRELLREIELEFVRILCPWALPLYTAFLAHLRHATRRHVEGVRIPTALRRCSGEAGTSQWNGLINAFSVFWSHFLHGYPMDWDAFLVEGDDSLDAISPPEFVVDDCAMLGLAVKVESGRTLETVSFLGRYHHTHGDKVRSQCDIFRTLRKYHFSAQSIGGSSFQELRTAKSLAYLATDYGTPLVGAIAWAMVQRGGSITARALRVHAHRLSTSGRHLDSLFTLPAPEPSVDAWACACYQTGMRIETLTSHHQAWLAWGLSLGTMPPPVMVPLKDTTKIFEV